MHCNGRDCAESLCAHGCLREHEAVVRNLVYHILRDPNEVDDAVQEVLIKAYQSLGAFRGGSFRAYLGRIARNHCYDVLRRHKSRGQGAMTLMPDDLPSTERGPEDIVVSRELVSEVSSILNGLNQVDREIMLLRHVHDFGYEEIAAVVGLKPGAVRTRISRARQRIVEEVERRGQRESFQLG